MKNDVQTPALNAGFYDFMQRLFQIMADLEAFSHTKEGIVLTELDYLATFERFMNGGIDVILSCMTHEVREHAHRSISE